ncbi:MAG TPA: hypothetical protein VNG11_07825 [Chloroflexota bacterium]|nr:hypothetical protein [Chloroflexota bacterium]
MITPHVPNRQPKRPRRYRWGGVAADGVNLVLFAVLFLLMAAIAYVLYVGAGAFIH